MKSSLVFVILAILVLVGVIVYLVYSSTKQSSADISLRAPVVSPNPLDPSDIVSKLKEAGVKIYGTDSCIWTQRQLDEFGPARARAEADLYVACDKRRDECEAAFAGDASVGYPTWYVPSVGKAAGYKPMADILRMFA